MGSLDDVIIARGAQPATAERTAFVFEGQVVSYGRLAQRTASVAAALAAAGIARGDRVVFCGLNRIELFETMLACWRIGAAVCPINNRLTPAEVAVLLADCEPSLLVATDGFDQLLADALGPGGTVRNLDADPIPDIDIDSPERAADGDGGESAPGGSPDDPALIVYTSGTTGTPKGAVLTQAALLATWHNSIDHQGLGPEDRVIAPLPTFHVGGLNIQTLPTLAVGGQVLLQRRFDPEGVLDLVEAHRPTQTLLVPAMLAAVAALPRFTTTDLGSLRGINTGSSIVPEAVMRPFFDRGIPVGQVYGTTETGPTAVVLRYEEAEERIGSCGRPALETELRIVDAEGAEVEPGVGGELWVRGPNVFSRYWRNPEATAEAFTDGWYRTGDVGHRDADGYVYISDRLKDVIITGGENVYSAEVEAVIGGHPAVAEVAVVGRSDDRWGETPVAVVIPVAGADPPDLDLDAVVEWCGDRLARFKHPRELVVVADLPRTALGKVRKHELRERLGLH